MQGSKKWAPPGGVLAELLASAESRVGALRSSRAEIEAAADAAPRPPSFAAGLNTDRVAVIAEVKRASPSKGEINRGLGVTAQCKAYEEGGAAAISVLTEPTRFGGELTDLAEARKATALPLLRKDFIIDDLQILEARAAGASSVLLIARALDPAKLKDLFRTTVECGLYALVEVRDERELDTALSVGANVIGVNNRNLETLVMDDAAVRILPLIPKSCIAVAESGYRTAAEIRVAGAAGADAVLIGSELSAALRPAQLLAELISVERSRNARKN